MRSRVPLILAGLCVGVSACAAILGIDDGISRTQDASTDAPTQDAGLDAAKDVVGADAVDAPFIPLQCGTSPCNAALGQDCCRTGPATFVCVDAGGTCTGTLIECDRPEMCPPDDSGPVVCCGDLVSTDAGAVASAVSCKPVLLCTYASHAYLCDDASECPPDASCLQSTFTIPPYFICK